MDLKEKYKYFCLSGKFLDKKYIQEIIKTYIITNNLNSIVRNVKIDTYGNSLAVFMNDTLIIRYNSILDYVKKCHNYNPKNASKYSYIDINNEILSIIFHELTHVEQKKCIIEKTKDKIIREYLKEGFLMPSRKITFEKGLLPMYELVTGNNSFHLKEIKNANKEPNSFYQKYHSFIPIEYNANLEGLLKTIDFTDDIGLINNKYQKSNIYKYLLTYYIVNPFGCKSPVETVNDLRSIETNRDDFKNISELDKVLYGLPIENETYQKIMEIPKQKSIKFREYFK